MKNQSLVSIIIATFNRSRYIKKAIESVLRQSYENIEIIVVDDGSTDDTKEVVNFYLENKKIKYIYQANTGPAGARNKGIKNSKGKYIAILDSDDFWSDGRKLEKQVRFLEKNSDYVLVGGGVIVVDGKGKEIDRYLLPEKDNEIRDFILLNNSFAQVAVMFKKEAWEKAGGYNEAMNFSEDWDLWLRMGKIGKFYNFQEYFFYYLKGKQNRTNYYTIGRHLRENIKLRRKYRDVYPGYRKAYWLCWAGYFYYLLPFRRILRPILFKFRVLIFGQPSYRYFKKK